MNAVVNHFCVECDPCGRLKSQFNGQAMSTKGYAYALGLTLEY
ncbi:hypothetical protein [Nostoc foliaceum]|nr:hypothetical protein [Nostoc foliaceum]